MRSPKLVILLLCFLISLLSKAQQDQNDTIASLPNPSDQFADKKEIQEVAPVLFEGDTLFLIKYAPREFSVSFRADQISQQLELISKVYNPVIDSIYAKKEEGFISVMYNDKVAFVVTENDAKAHNLSLSALAETELNSFKKAMEVHIGYNLSITDWFIRIGYFLISLVVLLGLLWLVRWSFRKLNQYLSKFEKRFLKNTKNIFKYFIPKDTTNIFVFLSNVGRIIAIVFVLVAYMPFMFSFFPWAEGIVNAFYGHLASPIKFVFYGFINFLPNLIFITVIIIVTRYFIRILRDIVDDIEAEKFIISGFPKEWARTTQKIISLLIWAFALVLLYPHLPGATSPAFKGVSIFIGALISFGSTSAIANIVAGIVITYMSPYKIGDRIKIDNTIGDVIERTLLVTKIRTPKNEEVTIPNANVISGHMINYSANIENSGLLLHTSVTIGYDVPWVQVDKLLREAAQKSMHIEAQPPPFVLQTSLDDNYVSYEVNAYTKEVKQMPAIYSDIHRNILDAFNEAGVEILSPQYIAARDGNLSTVPSKLTPESKSPVERIVDHLTGQNQKIKIKKDDGHGIKDSNEG
jgi:small-conductance mechanosensitive channel